ncbi:MAG: DUF4870 domain-containing protein [Planctomycetota bacterium]|jgi:hypothetical protein|nr:hypothetical protein [Planctomycetota bacterium]MDP6368200.1 DUF4870 domain-containing protein [Planctomycetota bacterium]MDP6518908.1 DUF4870 domain-containing protein [Planctomycetota bacterium]MDP6839001.1 DUF4870 domain-containing protein [Planctomycetota bacterium]MDP6955620.1 DUF4870 domain-containing protein [Planctomycetota bacterium]
MNETDHPVPSKDSCTLALVVHLLAILTGFLGPLVIYLIKKEEDEFVRFHSLQATYFMLIGILFAIVTCGIGAIVLIVFNIIAMIRAMNGEWYRYPLAGNWAAR